MLIKFFVPSDFMEEVLQIIKKPWREGGIDKGLLKQAGIKQHTQNRDCISANVIHQFNPF